MYRWISDPIVMEYLDWGTNSIDETAIKLNEAIEEIKKTNRGKYFFAIESKIERKVIGDVGFTVLAKNEFGGIAECGYFLQKEYWGRGMATEATRRIIEYVFSDLGLHKIIAGCDAENKASERIMIKCGMKKEGAFMKHHFRRNKWLDRLKYGLLKEDWLKLRSKNF